MGRKKKCKEEELCEQCKNPNQKGICTCGKEELLDLEPMDVPKKQCSMCSAITEYHYLIGDEVYCLDCSDNIIKWVVNKYREETGK